MRSRSELSHPDWESDHHRPHHRHQRQHGASSGPWTSVPSTVIGCLPSGWMRTWNGFDFAGPRQKVCRGRTRRRANPAVPGPTARSSGLNLKLSCLSWSPALRDACMAALPRLSTATSWVPRRLPREFRGMSSAVASANAPMATVPSSTVDPCGSSRDWTRTANGMSPARVWAVRGGRNVTATISSWPGNSRTIGGADVAHGPASPRTSTVNSSTTCPVF